MPPTPGGALDEQLDTLFGELTDLSSPWVVILWNDPVNTQAYVTKVLTSVLSIPTEQAASLMKTADQEGKVVVDAGDREHVEEVMLKLTSKLLWATVQRDD